MKRLITLMLASVFVLGTVASAFAIHTQGRGGTGLDFNARGSWRAVGEFRDSWAFGNELTEQDGNFRIHQRARVWFDFTTADNIKGVMNIQMGNFNWGDGFGAIGGAPAVVGLRQLYLQFPWPNSDITISAGKQGVALPGYFSSPVHDDNIASLVVSMPLTDALGLTLVYGRAIDGGLASNSNEYDVFAAILPVTLEGMSLTPYAVWRTIGADTALTASGERENTWWAGVNAMLTMFDPIYVAADFIYGNDSDDDGLSGWFANAAVGMKMDMFTPELFAIYATGGALDDRMPWISPDYVATTFFFAGSPLLAGSGAGAGKVNTNPASLGLWAVGLSLKNISFVDKLTHTFRVMYAQGNNDDGLGLMTSDDSFVELNFDTTYKMYEHLAAIVELGYIMPSFDEFNGGNDDGAFKLAAGFKYDF
jgi:hypothetical protein